MRLPSFRALPVGRTLAVVVPLIAAVPVTRVVAGTAAASAASPTAPPPPKVHAELVNVPRRSSELVGDLSYDSLVGYSGQLRARLLTRDDVGSIPALTTRYGAAARAPGVRTLAFPRDDGEFAFITLKPWRDKLGSHINTYHVGWWPGENRPMSEQYGNPVGFIEVTPDVAGLRLSTHFRLADFITHDQERIWPKYVVLREELLDKLELVLLMLQAQGVPTRHVVVLSGFRTPQYNRRAVYEGAAYASRHQYGDAADLIIDADRDGRMDDLNRDGVVNFQDTDVIRRSVELVERKYPDLVGGLGLYHATGPRGPFAHIDVRGTRARWTNASRPAGSGERAITANAPAQAPAVGKCRAEGEMAVLCARVR